MTPEAVKKEPVDHRSDLFSLGIGLYEFTVGKRLFKASSPSETMQRIKNGKVPPPKTFQQDFPEPLSEVLLKCLHVNPNERFESGKALAEALSSAAEIMGEPMGKACLRSYVQSIFHEDIESRREELKTLVDRVDSAEDQAWTSVHMVNTLSPSGSSADDSSTGEHDIAAPSGRETMELDTFLNQGSSTYPPLAIERPELGPLGDSLSGEAVLSTCRRGSMIKTLTGPWNMLMTLN